MYFTKATSGDNNPRFYTAGIFAIFVGYLVGQIPLFLVQYYKIQSDTTITKEEVEEFMTTLDFSLLNIHSNVGLILMILIFLVALLAFMLVLKFLHKRPIKDLITPKSQIDYRKILFGFGFWFVIALAFEGVLAYLYPETYYFNFKPMSWIGLLLICVIFLPIQTSLEELFVRGYLMPGLALAVNNKWLPLILTSVMFSLIHSANPEVQKFGFWTMQPYYIGAGLFLGLITILDDSLELALGVHAATNIFGAAFFSFEGSVLQTDSMVKATEINPGLMTIAFLAGAIIFILVCNKKYKWQGLTRLLDPVPEQDSIAYDDSLI